MNEKEQRGEAIGSFANGFSKREVNLFLKHSNKIEQETSPEALEDAKKAWDFISKKPVITPSVVLCVHDLLMVRLNRTIAGNWRDCPVFIGGRVCPYVSQALIEEEVKEVCHQINKSIKDREDLSKVLHIAFEQIHPFEDGNGRVGRIIYNWHRMQLGLPLHLIKGDWPKRNGEQIEYYSWFKGK